MSKLPTKSARVAAAKPAKAAPAAKTAKPAAKTPAKNPDEIKEYKKANSNPNNRDMLVKAVGGQHIIFDEARLNKQLNALLGLGKSFAAVTDYLAKAPPVLARGVESRAAPHSSKSVADNRATTKTTDAKLGATKRAAPAKPDSVDAKMAITATAKGDEKIKRMGPADRLAIMVKAKTVGEALKSMSMGDIRYAARVGLITLG